MHEGHTVQIFVVHGHSGDLVVIVGRVVIDTCIGVAAACVEGDLVLAVIQLTAAALLLYRAEDVEELADTAHLVVGRFRVAPGKGHFDKAGHRGKVARQADAARRALEAVTRASESLEAGITPDALLTDAEEALAALGELTGASVREDVTARIFERFCVGK